MFCVVGVPCAHKFVQNCAAWANKRDTSRAIGFQSQPASYCCVVLNAFNDRTKWNLLTKYIINIAVLGTKICTKPHWKVHPPWSMSLVLAIFEFEVLVYFCSYSRHDEQNAITPFQIFCFFVSTRDNSFCWSLNVSTPNAALYRCYG